MKFKTDSGRPISRNFQRFEAQIFIRPRVELRLSARTETPQLGGVVRAVARPLVQGVRIGASMHEEVPPAGFIVMQAYHLMADRAFRIERMKPLPPKDL